MFCHGRVGLTIKNDQFYFLSTSRPIFKHENTTRIIVSMGWCYCYIVNACILNTVKLATQEYTAVCETTKFLKIKTRKSRKYITPGLHCLFKSCIIFLRLVIKRHLLHIIPHVCSEIVTQISSNTLIILLNYLALKTQLSLWFAMDALLLTTL